MDDASMSPSAQLQNIISPAIPAPTQNQGIQRKLMSSRTTKVTDSGKTTKQNPNGHPGTPLPWGRPPQERPPTGQSTQWP